MVKYDKINAFDIEDQGIVIVDANLSGVIDYPGFAETYPKAYDLYKKTCMFNYKNRVGTYMVVEENKKKVVVVFTSLKRKCDKDLAIEAFKTGIFKVFHILPSDVFIYSPILGRRSGMFSSYMASIKSIATITKDAPRNWTVCTKGER